MSHARGQTAMSRPLVSVIVPAFAAQATILRCLRSLSVTTLGRHEVEVLVEPDDGGSYDGLDSAGLPVKVARTSIVKSGPGPTRNRALRRACGDWITYVDADDHVAPGFLDRLLEAARCHGAALAQTRIEKDGQPVLQVGQDGGVLRFADWSRTGVSLRGMFHRSRCPEFLDLPAQDILHIVDACLGHGGRLRFSKAVYVLTLGDDTVTTQPEFKAQLPGAYRACAEHIRQRHAGAQNLAEALAFWEAKADLNTRYMTHSISTTYYEFIAANVREG
jgi:glycosyltransferase involved in cell wall biosynthesis